MALFVGITPPPPQEQVLAQIAQSKFGSGWPIGKTSNSKYPELITEKANQVLPPSPFKQEQLTSSKVIPEPCVLEMTVPPNGSPSGVQQLFPSCDVGCAIKHWNAARINKLSRVIFFII
jgi:hypothetical protein